MASAPSPCRRTTAGSALGRAHPPRAGHRRCWLHRRGHGLRLDDRHSECSERDARLHASPPSNEVDPELCLLHLGDGHLRVPPGRDDAFGACSSLKDYSGLAEAATDLRCARATDAAGNTGAATVYDWTIDTSAPSVTLDALRPLQRGRSESRHLHLGDGHLRVPPGRRCLWCLLLAAGLQRARRGGAHPPACGPPTLPATPARPRSTTAGSTRASERDARLRPLRPLQRGRSELCLLHLGDGDLQSAAWTDDAFGACSSPKDYSNGRAYLPRAGPPTPAGNTGASFNGLRLGRGWWSAERLHHDGCE